jgi:hypothetical protein
MGLFYILLKVIATLMWIVSLSDPAGLSEKATARRIDDGRFPAIHPFPAAKKTGNTC